MLSVVTALSCIIIITIAIAIYQKTTNSICKSKKRLDGKVVIVTGGTAGMGYHVAKNLVKRGARVIIASPFITEGETAEKQIKEETKNENVEFKPLDLASLRSIRQFTTEILNTEERLDILVNNAGVGIPHNFKTFDGMNFIMQVNYYGHFLLTMLLLPLLKRTGTPEDRSRIVNVSSLFHWFGRTDLSKINETGDWIWSRFLSYGDSKFCLALFAHELSKRSSESNVVVNSVDPGTVGTRIFDSLNVFLGSVITALASGVCKTPWEGAQTTLHVALDDSAEKVSGQFFKNCRMIKARPAAYNDTLSKLLWEQSTRLVKLSEEEVEKCLKR